MQTVLKEKQTALAGVTAEIEALRQAKDKSSDRVTTAYSDLHDLRDKKHKLEVQKTELLTRKKVWKSKSIPCVRKQPILSVKLRRRRA